MPFTLVTAYTEHTAEGSAPFPSSSSSSSQGLCLTLSQPQPGRDAGAGLGSAAWLHKPHGCRVCKSLSKSWEHPRSKTGHHSPKVFQGIK